MQSLTLDMSCPCAWKLLQAGRCWQCKRAFILCVVPGRSLPCGTSPFAGISSARALADLRELLGTLDVAKASLYRTHDLRRGHAQDIVDRGGTKAELLGLGDWSSKGMAYTSYIDMLKAEAEATRVAEGDSSDEEEEV